LETCLRNFQVMNSQNNPKTSGNPPKRPKHTPKQLARELCDYATMCTFFLSLLLRQSCTVCFWGCFPVFSGVFRYLAFVLLFFSSNPLLFAPGNQPYSFVDTFRTGKHLLEPMFFEGNIPSLAAKCTWPEIAQVAPLRVRQQQATTMEGAVERQSWAIPGNLYRYPGR